MAFAALLSIGVVVIVFGFQAVQHASNPSQNAPAGGIEGFTRLVRVLGLFFGALTAIMIGAEAGTADNSSGVFRDLVATGRSRVALFLVRLPAAMVVSLTLVATAYALGLIGTFVLADGEPTPSVTLILQSAGWIALANTILVTFAVGIGSLTGSRAVALTAVIGWQMVATQLLLNVKALGAVRDALLTVSLRQVAPINIDAAGITMTTGAAVAVLLGWLVIPTAVGAWRTRTQDA